MKRISVYFASLASLALALTLIGSGCGGGKTDKEKGAKADGTTPPAKGEGSTPAPATKTAVKPGDGVITGKVVLEGDIPPCMTLKEVAEVKGCKAPTDQQFQNCDQTWTVNSKDRGVANVLIVLKVPAGEKFEAPKQEGSVEIDQPHCAFIPHVVTVKPGQKLVVKNSAEFNHNSKLFGKLPNPGEQGSTIPPKEKLTFDIKPQKGPLFIKCDVHGWMKAYVFAFDHPYSVVTDMEGNYKIEHVPTDTKLKIAAWHEGSGTDGYFAERDITVGAKETKTEDFKLSATK